MKSASRGLGAAAAAWGIAGITLMLGAAVVRLAPVAWEALASPLSARQWLAVVAAVVVLGVVEGYSAFQRGFSPRTAARARHLADHPTPLRALLAPLFCMGFFAATRRLQTVTVAITLMVAVLVAVVRRLDQPWRGIVDAGVVVGLTWGLVALWVFTARAFSARGLDHPAEVPS